MVNTEDYLTQPIQWLENEIYYSTDYNNYIFKANKKGGHQAFIVNYKEYKISNDSTFQWECFKVRLATLEEKQWFLACEKAGKFVSKPEYTNSLEQIEIW